MIQNKINIGQFVAAEIIVILIMDAVEKLILGMDIMYDLPDQERGVTYTIDETVVTGSRRLFSMPPQPQTKSA